MSPSPPYASRHRWLWRLSSLTMGVGLYCLAAACINAVLFVRGHHWYSLASAGFGAGSGIFAIWSSRYLRRCLQEVADVR